MLWFDAWLIDKAERFSHFTQQWFGITSASWERLFLCLTLLQMLFKEIPIDWGKAVMLALDGYIILQCIYRFVKSLNRKPSMSTETTSNPEKLEYTTRTLIVCMAILFLPIDVYRNVVGSPWARSYWFQCSAIAYIFAACDDLPWSESKIKQLVRAVATLFLSPKPA